MTAFVLTCATEHQHLCETLSTLRFGQCAKRIKTKIKANKELSTEMLKQVILELETRVAYFQSKERAERERGDADKQSEMLDRLRWEFERVAEERDLVRTEFEAYLSQREHEDAEDKAIMARLTENYEAACRRIDALVAICI